MRVQNFKVNSSMTFYTRLSLLNLLFTAFLLGVLGCSSDDGVIDIIPVDPMDTMNDPGNDPMRTYTSDTYSVGDWTVEVFVPSDYDSTLRYPALYFNDGDLFGDLFAVLTTLDAPPFIMIGLSGSNSRSERFLPYEDAGVSDELGPYTPNASGYSDAIVGEIIPFVEANFNINRNKQALFGISFGGLHATWMAINYPQVFSFVGAMSPSYWVADESIFGEDLSGLDPPGLSVPTRIYYDRGQAEWRNHLSFISKLKGAGLEYGESLFYYEVPGADHMAEDWLLRIDVPFRLFLEGVDSAEDPTLFELRSYCAQDLSNNDKNTTRLNPIVYYENGVRFSVITEANYDITNGSGTIGTDGTYVINGGTSMVVRATYQGMVATQKVSECN